MGLFDRLERGLERAVNGAFAKAFKSSVQPVEIASAMRRAMDDRAAATSKIHGGTASQAVVPNMFTVELSTRDYDDLTAYADDLTDELLASAEEHIDSQRYRTAGPMRIVFAENTDLETGVFTLRPASSRRPFDIRPAGVADRERAPQHDYEEFAELSIGMPVISPDAARPEPSHPQPEPRAWGSEAAPATARPAAPAQPAPVAPAAPRPAPPAPAPGPAAGPYGAPNPYTRPGDEEPPARRPAPVKRPWLDIDGDRYPLLGALTIIGRDHGCDIVLDDPGISRRHAEIRITHDGPHAIVTLTDLQSTNGVFVNGERIGQAHVADGDRLTLGRSSMVLRTGR